MTLQQERVIMKVSEFAAAEIARRPYKYQTCSYESQGQKL